jgi:hypothetical protein
MQALVPYRDFQKFASAIIFPMMFFAEYDRRDGGGACSDDAGKLSLKRIDLGQGLHLKAMITSFQW